MEVAGPVSLMRVRGPTSVVCLRVRHYAAPMRTAMLTFLLSVSLLACGDQDDSHDDSGDPHDGAGDTGAVDDPCGPADVPDATPLDLAGDAACGDAIWQARCAGCHGGDGLGGDGGPTLDEHVPAHTDEELVFVIVAGTDEMPVLGLGNQEVAHSLAWLRDRFGDYDGVGH